MEIKTCLDLIVGLSTQNLKLLLDQGLKLH